MSILDILGNGNGHAKTIRRKQMARAIADLRGKAEVTKTSDFGWEPVSTLFTAGDYGDTPNSATLAKMGSKSAIVYACQQELASSIAEAPLMLGRETDAGFEPIPAAEPLKLFYENDPRFLGSFKR